MVALCYWGVAVQVSMVALCYWRMRLEISMVRCFWGMALQVSMVARCYEGIPLQVVKRIVRVASRWCCFVDGGAVLLGNVIRGFHGGAVFMGNLIQVALGCGWWGCARGKCMQRVANCIVMVVSRWLWVVGLRRCARGKCMHRVANRIVMAVSRCRCRKSRDFNWKVLRKWQKLEINRKVWPKSRGFNRKVTENRDANRKVPRKWQKVEISLE